MHTQSIHEKAGVLVASWKEDYLNELLRCRSDLASVEVEIAQRYTSV